MSEKKGPASSISSKLNSLVQTAKKHRKSGWALLFSGLIASSFAVAQISSDIQTISSGSGDEITVIHPTGASSISEIVGATGGLDVSCTYQGIEFKNTAGGLVEISEAQWLAEQPGGTTRFKYRCLNGKLSSDFTLQVLPRSDKAQILVEGVVSEGDATNLALGVNLQGDGNLECDGGLFDLPIMRDGQFLRFSGAISVKYDEKKDCRFTVPYKYAPGTQATMTKVRSASLSRQIDALLVSNTPAACAYVAGVIPWEIPSSEDRKQADWINSVSVNAEEFMEYSATADQYRFDPYLGFKLQFRPDWTWVCREGSLQYSELHFGGYWYGDNGVEMPGKNDLRMEFNPWVEEQINARATIELFDNSLNSCGTAKVNIVTRTEYDSWYRAIDLLDLGDLGIDTDTCRIVSLKEFSVD